MCDQWLHSLPAPIKLFHDSLCALQYDSEPKYGQLIEFMHELHALSDADIDAAYDWQTQSAIEVNTVSIDRDEEVDTLAKDLSNFDMDIACLPPLPTV
jgi:hypothetical protein